MPAPPEGTITFLFTDIAGSSSRFERLGDAMHAALARHDQILRDVSESHSGYPFKTWGDAFFVAFPTAPQGVAAALEAQRNVTASAEAAAVGGLPVRMVLHTGAAEYRNGDYYGDALNRTDRLLKIANGGQILLSGSAADLAEIALPEGCELKDLGQHRLRDLQRAERVYQLRHPELPADFPPLRSLGYLPTNLPQQLTSFIGREREIEQVKTLLSKTRLLTLTGSGGCGKTRLALQVAAEVLDEYPDGVWLVELAALREAELVSRTVGAALGLSEESGKDATSTLSQYLRTRKLLLILDNCEHLVDAVASLTESLLRECASLRVLATSREGLAVEGETVWRVPSLPVPKLRANVAADLDAALSSEAVSLFMDRARSASPGFELTNAGAAATVEICRKLDGIPLAIELAAAMVNVLSPEQIAERLVDFFRVLTRGHRTALPRQKTLLGAIQWSYDLLTEPQQTLLRRLSVFQGGWTLEAAEDVCSGDGIDTSDVLDLLTGLVDKSLVIVDETTDSTPRYRFLQTVQQFGLVKLHEAQETQEFQERHRDHFLALAEEAEPQLQGVLQKEWLDRLEREHDNIRLAIAWSIEPPTALRMGAALWRFWYVRGHFSEGRAVLAGALARCRATDEIVRSRALNGHGVLCCAQGDYGLARESHLESLSLRRKIGEPFGIAGSLNNLGLVAKCTEDYDSAWTYYQESLEIYELTSNQAGLAMVLSNLGVVAMLQQQLVKAEGLFLQSVKVFEQLTDAWGLSAALHNLAEVQRKKGDISKAATSLREALRRSWEAGDRGGIALTLGCIGLVSVDQGQFETAARLFGASAAVLESVGGTFPASTHRELTAAVDLLRRKLGHHQFSAISEDTRSISMSDAVDFALSVGLDSFTSA